MDGLNRILGRIITPLDLPNGDTLRLSPLTLADLADEESFHGAHRGADPLTLVREHINCFVDFDTDDADPVAKARDMAAKNWRAQFKGGERHWSSDVPPETLDYAQSPEGMAWRLARSARREHPQFVLAHGFDLVGKFAAEGRIVYLTETLDIAVGARDLQWIEGDGETSIQWRVPWAQILPMLFEKFGWTYQDVGEMTMYQVSIALGNLAPESGIVTRRNK